MPLSRVDIAAVILSFANEPLHYNQDLSYIAEVLRNGEDKDPKTPWSTMRANLGGKIGENGWYVVKHGKGFFSLEPPEGMTKRDAVIAVIGQSAYDEICTALRAKGFLNAQNQLTWQPQKDYIFNGENPLLPSQQNTDSLLNRIDKLLKASYQVILTGAPGTGKTFTAKQLAEKWIKETGGTLEENFCQVQFHPGYDYADFIIGLKPQLVKERVSFAWESGIFKSFADKARRARDAEKKQPKPYIFLIDEINRADLSRVFGEVFSLLEEDYRYPKNKSGIKLPDRTSFILPDNLYIIATMNDIDRSVESMDFALRRRFSFLEVTAKESVVIIEENEDISGEDKKTLLDVMTELNKYIGSENELLDGKYRLDLGNEYQLGGAYFVHFAKYRKQKDTAWDKLWSNHLAIILNEYLRGHRSRHEIILALKEIYDRICRGDRTNA